MLAFQFFAFSLFRTPQAFLGSVQNLYTFENVIKTPEKMQIPDEKEDGMLFDKNMFVSTDSHVHDKSIFGIKRKMWIRDVSGNGVTRFLSVVEPKDEMNMPDDKQRFRLGFLDWEVALEKPGDVAEIVIAVPRYYNTYGWKYYAITPDGVADFSRNVVYDTMKIDRYQVTVLTMKVKDG